MVHKRVLDVETWSKCAASLLGDELLPAFPHYVLPLQQAAHTQEALEEAVQMMKEAVEDLTTTLNEAASAAGVVGGMVDSITQAINQVSAVRSAPSQGWGWGRGKLRVKTYKESELDLEPESHNGLLQLDEVPMGEPEGSFVDYQTTMVKTAKAIAVTVQEMVGASKPVTAENAACHPGRAVILLASPFTV